MNTHPWSGKKAPESAKAYGKKKEERLNLWGERLPVLDWQKIKQNTFK